MEHTLRVATIALVFAVAQQSIAGENDEYDDEDCGDSGSFSEIALPDPDRRHFDIIPY